MTRTPRSTLRHPFSLYAPPPPLRVRKQWPACDPSTDPTTWPSAPPHPHTHRPADGAAGVRGCTPADCTFPCLCVTERTARRPRGGHACEGPPPAARASRPRRLLIQVAMQQYTPPPKSEEDKKAESAAGRKLNNFDLAAATKVRLLCPVRQRSGGGPCARRPERAAFVGGTRPRGALLLLWIDAPPGGTGEVGTRTPTPSPQPPKLTPMGSGRWFAQRWLSEELPPALCSRNFRL